MRTGNNNSLVEWENCNTLTQLRQKLASVLENIEREGSYAGAVLAGGKKYEFKMNKLLLHQLIHSSDFS
ncbi:MAG: hypothetical protein V7L01_25815 [Nostoc sp.]